MIPEIGQLALIIALLVAVLHATACLVAAARDDALLLRLARPGALAQLLFVTIAFACLVTSFVMNDFSVAYVVTNSNSSLPLRYRIAATWGGHEGSLLLWVQMLVLWMGAVAWRSTHLAQAMVARVLGVMAAIDVGFLCFLLFASNPFDRQLPAAFDGNDLNPLLQDIGMIIHPPLLYMGYVGFSVAFAFALAALLSGRLDAAWARWSRPWTLLAWTFLTLGIFVGSTWAYYELGWGGWWFWDAVENASFMPWLVGTALVHSLIVTEKRGSFRNWTVLLAIVAFSLSLLGTFLVRSGVLTSVHAFAADPRRGLFILIFLALVVGTALTLYAWRAPQVGLGERFGVLSRESLLLVNNVMLMAAAATVFLGTLYPLFLDALNAGKISVGPPYFEAVFVPLMLPVLALIGVAPFARWKNATVSSLWVRVRWMVVVAVLTGAGLAITLRYSLAVAIGVTLAVWILLSCLVLLLDTLRKQGPGGLTRQPRSHWGMLLAHTGVAIFVIGVTLVKGQEQSVDMNMRLGDRASVGGYDFRLIDMRRVEGPNYSAAQAWFMVTAGGRAVTLLKPEKRVFTVRQTPMTEAAIDRGLTRDLYVSLGDQTGVTSWQVRVQVKPFVSWIWCGCIVMALGGLLAATDRRYRVRTRSAWEAP